MLHDWGVIAAAFGYIGILFLVASHGDRLSPVQRGRPKIFISHGTEDTVLPIENTRRLVTRLRDARYDVRYDEFRGPHRTPDAVASAGFAWFTDSSSSAAQLHM